MGEDRSKEYWLKLVESEPDVPIGAGVPDYIGRPVGRFGRILLRLRASFAILWRVGIISRGTAFRWEMDAFLGEWSRKPTHD